MKLIHFPPKKICIRCSLMLLSHSLLKPKDNFSAPYHVLACRFWVDEERVLQAGVRA